MVKLGLNLVFILLFSIGICRTQTPNNDPHWILDFSENFDSINPSIYNYSDSQEDIYKFEPANVSINSGQLNLTAIDGGSQFLTAGINTRGKKEFSYGYFEIDAQFPIGPNRAGYWCVFWLQKGSCHNYGEIDIWEPNGQDAIFNDRYHCGLWGTSGSPTTIDSCHQCLPIDPGSCNCEDLYCKRKSGFLPSLGGSLTSWNKYSFEWTPQHGIYYHNNQPIDFATFPTDNLNDFHPAFPGNAQIVPSRKQELYLTFQMDEYVQPTTTFPAVLKFDNFKYYRLNVDCNTPLVAGHFNFMAHTYRVQKFISLTHSAVPLNTKIFLRAVEYVELNGSFTVPLGSELTVITHYGFCPN